MSSKGLMPIESYAVYCTSSNGTYSRFLLSRCISQQILHVFINHRGPDVKKTFASHLYHRLCSAHIGLKVFLDQPEMRVGENFPSQIKDAIRSAYVHVAIFSAQYAESEWCLNELLYMLESKAPIIPVFYHVEPAVVRWPQGKGVYAEALRILEDKKTYDAETHEEKPRHDPATIKSWREALSRVSEISGLDLHGSCNGDEGALVEKIVQRVLEEVDSILSAGISVVYCSEPCGGIGGGDWSDGTYSGIRRITMTHKANLLISIQLDYRLEGDESLKDRYISGLRHGGAHGVAIVFDLNYPEEIVTKISGYIGTTRITINSITFHTTQRNLGPCGQQQGTYFETEAGGKIVGLFGSSGDLLDSIGVYMQKPRTSKDEVFYRSQLYGGPGGDYWNDGTYSGIRRITMTAKDNSLTSVQLHYSLEGDESDIFIFGLRHGSADGAPIEYILNYPEEIITNISGYYGSYESWPLVIKSLTFHTNERKLGPCGQECGTHFETEMGGKIVGLFGSSATVVDSIGVYMRKPRTSKDEEFYEFYCSQIYGGIGGIVRSDGTYSGIRRITMTHKGSLLTSVQLYYGLKGDASLKNIFFPGLRHGGAGGTPIEYNLNYSHEIVTKISGYFGSYKSWPLVIKSLTFHTNHRKLGPCGQEQGTHFETEVKGKIVGIFASSGTVMDSIGVYMLKRRTSQDETSEGH